MGITRYSHKRIVAQARATKYLGHLLSPTVVTDFLNKPRDNWQHLKELPRKKLEDLVYPQFDDFHTEPWTHQLVGQALGMSFPGFEFLLDMGLGKALRNKEQVLTPSGFVRIDSLQIGDLVIGSNGKPTKVTGVFPQGLKKLYEVKFSDLTSVHCCAEHLWAVRTAQRKRNNDPYQAKTIKEILKQGVRDQGRHLNNCKHFIPIVSPVLFKDSGPLPIHPYLLGALLGDGGLGGGIGFTTADLEMIEILTPLLPPKVFIKKASSGRYGYALVAHNLRDKRKKGSGRRSNPLLNLLRELELVGHLSYTKFIPKQYLFAPPKQRLELLQGLMDTDGYVDKKGHTDFASASMQLAEGVVFLVRSLGGIAKLRGPIIHKKRSSVTGEPFLHFNVSMRMPHDLMPFKLTRKVERARNHKQKYGPTKAIIDIVPVGLGKATCITVAAQDGLFLTNSFTVTHNSNIILNLIRYHMLNNALEGVLVLVPSAVNVETWSKQIKKHRPELRSLQLIGSQEDRFRMLEEPADVYLMNYAGLMVYMAELEEKKKKGKTVHKMTPNKRLVENFLKRFNGVVFDEGHLLGDHSSLLYRLCKRLSNHCWFRIGMTGTPFGRDPTRLWSQFYLTDHGETLGETLAVFRQAFFTPKANFWGGVDWTFDTKKEDRLHEIIQHRSIRYEDYECQDLPTLSPPERLPIQMTDEQKLYYQRVVKKVKEVRGDYRSLESAFIRMRQITAGFLGFKNEEEERLEIQFEQNPKIDAIKELLECVPVGSKVVIYHEFLWSGRLICKALDALKVGYVQLSGLVKGTKQKIANYNRFLNDPKIQVLVANTISAGTGVDELQMVSRFILFYELPVDPKTYRQAVKRIHRPGQQNRVYVYILEMEHSIDGKIWGFIEEGKSLFDAICSGQSSLLGTD